MSMHINLLKEGSASHGFTYYIEVNWDWRTRRDYRIKAEAIAAAQLMHSAHPGSVLNMTV